MAENTPNTQTETIEVKPRKRHYIFGIILGLAIAGGSFWLLYQHFYEKLLYKAEVKSIDYNLLQNANIGGIRDDIDQYSEVLKAEDVCLLPTGPFEKPFFNQAQVKVPADSADQTPPKTSKAREQEKVDSILEATVLVIAQGQTLEGKGFWNGGTGFFVSPNYVLTNRRLVGWLGDQGQVWIFNRLIGQRVNAEVVAMSRPEDLRDYALLRLDLDRSYQPKQLSIVRESKKTDRIRTFGYPGLSPKNDPKIEKAIKGDFNDLPSPVYADGVISLIEVERSPELISHTAEVSPGYNGGPLINQNGQVVGLNTFIDLNEDPGRQINVAFAGSDILDFLTENNIRVD